MWQPLIISLASSVILGFILIPVLRRLRFRQTVREDGPQSHLYKTGTPIMGGLIFIIPVAAIGFAYTENIRHMTAMIAAVAAFTAIGFADDMLKIIRKSNDGLTAVQKSIGLFIVSAVYSTFSVLFTTAGNKMILPFSALEKFIIIPEWIYIPFLIIFLYLMTNAVNLTDGVDGLASSVTAIVLLFFFMVIKAAVDTDFTDEKILILAMIGALIGFMFFNAHPAKVFMGDMGSMALGGLVGVLAIQMQMPWVILIAGIVYVMEAFSSFIQVMHYKRTKRRVFKMAPIHHHFELSGWKEQKVVLVFSSVTLAACVLAYFVLGLF